MRQKSSILDDLERH